MVEVHLLLGHDFLDNDINDLLVLNFEKVFNQKNTRDVLHIDNLQFLISYHLSNVIAQYRPSVE